MEMKKKKKEKKLGKRGREAARPPSEPDGSLSPLGGGGADLSLKKKT
jgi:hypothetical protein